MSMSVDTLLDRRSLRRKLSFWRILAFLILAALLVALAWASGLGKTFGKLASPHIARVEISGVITNDKPVLKLLKSLETNDQVDGIILEISSPGGSTVGGETLYEAVRSLAQKKPVVAHVGTLAASAGYMVAAASDHIVAHRSSIVGSIGVLFQYADVSDLLSKIGVKIDAVKSSPLKAEPSPFNKASPEALAMIDRLIQDSYVWFVELVAERRNFSYLKAKALADGSVFSGGQSLQNGLVDALGGEEVAVKWLEEEKGLTTGLEIISYKPERAGDSLFSNPASLINIARLLGFNYEGSAVDTIEKTIQDRLLLDGLVSIWQVSGTKELHTLYGGATQ